MSLAETKTKRKAEGRGGGGGGGGGAPQTRGQAKGAVFFCAPGAFCATSPKHSPSLAFVNETRLRGTP